ncbi:nuclear transport factor 2 family protein [Aeromonas sp. R9-2]|uniref:nuclear transport factor 2 family protein n=1 Tax=Aeromonas sp. R9-2 TaxID=3138479 RepID=UPI0034A40D1E
MDNFSRNILKQQVKSYLNSLEDKNLSCILALFAKNAWIHSPLAGMIKPEPFYHHLFDVSKGGGIKVRDIAVSECGNPCVYARFIYEWCLDDGRKSVLDCVDVFTFDEHGKIKTLEIIYDTYETRMIVGDVLTLKE